MSGPLLIVSKRYVMTMHFVGFSYPNAAQNAKKKSRCFKKRILEANQAARGSVAKPRRITACIMT